MTKQKKARSAYEKCDQTVMQTKKDATRTTAEMARMYAAELVATYELGYDVAVDTGFKAGSVAPLTIDTVNMFMDMVWKTHTKVAYGYHEVSPADADLSSYVVIWYCPQRATDDKYTKHRKEGATAGTYIGD
jgi:hypothetical protein